MFLYKLEIETEGRTAHAVVIADSDERAFAETEILMMRNFMKPSEKQAITLIEKKRLEKGAGYLIASPQ